MEKTTEVKAVRFLAKELLADGVSFKLGGGAGLTAMLSDFNDSIRLQLALHGLSQKIGDSAAGCAKDKAYGAALAAMTAVYDSLKAGKWGAEREGTGGQLMEDLIQAIASLKKMDVEAVSGAVRAADEATLKAWLKNAKIAAAILELKSKRAKLAAKESEEDFEFTV